MMLERGLVSTDGRAQGLFERSGSGPGTRSVGECPAEVFLGIMRQRELAKRDQAIAVIEGEMTGYTAWMRTVAILIDSRSPQFDHVGGCWRSLRSGSLINEMLEEVRSWA